MKYNDIKDLKLPKRVVLRNSQVEVTLIGLEKIEYEEINSINQTLVQKVRWIGIIRRDGFIKKETFSLHDLEFPDGVRKYDRHIKPKTKYYTTRFDRKERWYEE